MVGRNLIASFGKCFSKSFSVEVMCSPAYRELSPSAKDVCNLCFVKNDNSKFHKRRNEEGKPVFQFTVAEAVKLLKISNKTVSNSIKMVVEHGLIDWDRHGGLIGANGSASAFVLSNRWRDWKPGSPHRGRENIKKARAAQMSVKNREQVKNSSKNQ